MKKLIVAAIFLLFVFAGIQTDVVASRNDDHDDRRPTPRPTRTASPTPTPTIRPTSRPNDHHDDDHRDGRDGRHDDRDEDECEETSTPTPTHSSTPVATPTIMPSQTPIATSTPISDPDVCPNLEGIQTSLPDEYHFDTAHNNCLKFELGGPSQPAALGGANVLGTSTVNTGQVLGASTMAGTGVAEDSIFYSLFSIGSLLTSVGIMRNGKKK